MNAVLLSIRPKWCELIASGEKTVEVRKTRPKIPTPFKSYIYCTKGQTPLLVNLQNLPETPLLMTAGSFPRKKEMWDTDWARLCNGRVIGEFTCNKILDICVYFSERPVKAYPFPCTGLTDLEIMDYLGNGVKGYGLHISALTIYDKPHELSEFRLRRGCPNDMYCESCAMYNEHTKECGNEALILKRPPQSWCYVEETGW